MNYKNTFTLLVICAALLSCIPKQADAQISTEIARLFFGARIQVVNPQTSPQDFTLKLLNNDASKEASASEEASASLSSYKGKVVILNFWATWCPPCRAEMPSMETLYQRFNSQGLEILAVNIKEDANHVRQFIQNNKYTFPVMLDSDAKASGLYGINAIPTSFIINRDGKIIGKVTGSIHWDTPQVIAAFEALLRNN